jgi:phasin family protein
MADQYTKTLPLLTDGVASTMTAFEDTHTQVKANMDKTMQAAQDFAAFGQGTLEAVVASGQAWAAGVQELNQHLAASAQARITETVEAVKTFATAKSVNELISLQSTFARESLDKAVAETTKLTDATAKLANDVLAPLTARVTLAVDTFGRAA